MFALRVIRALFLIVLACAVTLAAMAVAVPVFFHLYASRYVVNSPEVAPEADVALVLGASVQGKNDLSPILKDRADMAIALYKTHKVSKILVSGDNGALDYDEVTPVRKYLVQEGVAPADIFLDHAGFDTYSSMYRALNVFEVHSMLVVSQPFHLPRAVFIARELGIDAYGVSSGEGDFFNTMREIPASDKALADIVFERYPKYLGPQEPISGDGQTTWK
jgi:SanA protein